MDLLLCRTVSGDAFGISLEAGTMKQPQLAYSTAKSALMGDRVPIRPGVHIVTGGNPQALLEKQSLLIFGLEDLNMNRRSTD